MNTLKLKSERHLEIIQREQIYEGENKITSFKISLPDEIGDYPRAECLIEMRCYLGENYISYDVDTSKPLFEQKVTSDITETARTVPIMFVITHEGNVIGKTNKVELEVLPAPASGEPLTPREQFDTRIAELESQVSDLNTEIDSLNSEVAAKDTEISGLNSQISTLTAEKTQLETENARQATTIDQLNSRVPRMETPEPVNPSTIQQTIRPSGDNVGLASVTVNPVTADIDPNIKPENIPNGVTILGVEGTAMGDIDDLVSTEVAHIIITADSFSNAFLAFGENLFRAFQSGLEEVSFSNIKFCEPYNAFFSSLTNLKRFNAPRLIRLGGYRWFSNCPKLDSVNLPKLEEISRENVFSGCSALEELILPRLKIFGTFSLGVANALNDCPKIMTVIVPSLERVGSNIANYVTDVNFKYLVIGNPDCTLINSSYFNNYRTLGANIYVPDDAVTTYQSATNWSQYADIIKPISELPEEIYNKYINAKEIAEND